MSFHKKETEKIELVARPGGWPASGPEAAASPASTQAGRIGALEAAAVEGEGGSRWEDLLPRR